MAKVELELVKKVLKRAAVDESVMTEIVEELQSAIKEIEEDDEPKPPQVKKQHVILLSDCEGEFVDKELVGWIFQMPEDKPMTEAIDMVLKASKSFNKSKKGRKLPVDTVGEACESIPAKIFKEHDLWLKTKEPVLIIPVKNSLQENELAQMPPVKNSEADCELE